MSSSTSFSSRPALNLKLKRGSVNVSASLVTDAEKSSMRFCDGPVDETSKSNTNLVALNEHPSIKPQLAKISVTKQSVFTQMNPNRHPSSKYTVTSPQLSTPNGAIKRSSPFSSMRVSDFARFKRPSRRAGKKFFPAVKRGNLDTQLKNRYVRTKQNPHHRTSPTAYISNKKTKCLNFGQMKVHKQFACDMKLNQKEKMKEVKYQDFYYSRRHLSNSRKFKLGPTESKKLADSPSIRSPLLSQCAPDMINLVPCKLLTREKNHETIQNYLPSLNCTSNKDSLKVLPAVDDNIANHSYIPNRGPAVKSLEGPSLEQQQHSLPKPADKNKPKLSISVCFTISRSPNSPVKREVDLKLVSKSALGKEAFRRATSLKPTATGNATGAIQENAPASKILAPYVVFPLLKQDNLKWKQRHSLNTVKTKRFAKAPKNRTKGENAVTYTVSPKATERLSTAYRYLLSNQIMKQRWTLHKKPADSSNLERNPFSIISSLASFVISKDPSKGWETLSTCLSEWDALQHKIYSPQREIHISFNKDVSKKYRYHNFTHANMVIACKIQLNDRGKNLCQVDVCCEQLRMHSSYNGNKGALAIWSRIHYTYYTCFVKELQRRIMTRLEPKQEEQ